MTSGLALLAFLLVATVVATSMLVGAWLLRVKARKDSRLKTQTYECGEAPVGQAWFNFNPRFYIVALIYIVFDVEIAFIYPVAAVFKRYVDQGQGLFALLEILVDASTHRVWRMRLIPVKIRDDGTAMLKG